MAPRNLAVDERTVDVGTRLRTAREQKGKTIRELAQTTKLAASAIDAIENNDFKKMPGGIFARATMRTLAREVGLEPESVVKAFVTQWPSAAPEGPEAVETEQDSSPLRGTRWPSIVVLLVVLAALLATYYFIEARRPVAATAIDRGPR